MHANIQHTSTHISLAGMFAYINTHKSQTTLPFLVWCRLDHLHMSSAHRPLESVCRPCLSIATVHWVSKISNYLPEVREQVPSTNPRIGLSPINLHSADDRYEKGKESLMPAPDLQRSINLVIRSANNNCQRRGGERRGVQPDYCICELICNVAFPHFFMMELLGTHRFSHNPFARRLTEIGWRWRKVNQIARI